MPELSSLSRFKSGSSFDNMTYRARLDNLKGGCTFTETSVSVSGSVDLIAERGPAGADGEQNFEYFVAVADDTGNILAKSTFTAPLTFAPGQSRAGSAEGLNELIQLKEPKEAAQYHVVIGFQLTPTERAYNTSRKIGQ
jgi:hypothetical protein